MSAVFVTATGTDIGKTFVTAGLVRALRRQGRTVEALKPVLSGFDRATIAQSDSAVLLGALGLQPDMAEIARISPWRYAAPLSPDMAAAREGRAVPFEDVVRFCCDRIAAASGDILIEGVGGVMVPLDESRTVLDWMAALGLPTLLVAGSYLGTISHTLTALAALRARGLPVIAVVVSETPDSSVPLDDTAATIRRFSGGADVVTLPREDAGCVDRFHSLSRLLPGHCASVGP
jgi:dethiobiotin synthetase